MELTDFPTATDEDTYKHVAALHARIDDIEAKLDRILAIADGVQGAFDGMSVNPIMSRMFGLGK